MNGQKPPETRDRSELPSQQRRGEFDLIERYFAPLAGPGAFALGDDAALLTPRPGEQLVFTADAIIAGVHFLGDDPGADVALKLLGVNLSDLAAMGARGVGYLITTAWPRTLPEAWIADFATGLGRGQALYDVELLGGDTVATDGPLSLSLTAIGALPTGEALRRNGAKIGDRIYVSGSIGDGGVGLQILRDALPGGDTADRQRAIERYRSPQPRLALGQALRGLASACIDVSDGLVADLGHLAEQSGVRMAVELPLIPLSPLADLIGGVQGAITAGDDYELLFTAPPAVEDQVLAAGQGAGTPVHCIGQVIAEQGVALRNAAGHLVTLDRPGYRHF
ncbi:MAG: thiamine-phosphate kinase [Rhodospirillaceae bacterium]|jgi:thiamine-monophosphate kinase|nr:thiamine-phosphate kinase [Rhodospirillaceae bacterium]MBT4686452.1 thiamine-phosphate kinase [Rhodospirillaceae bacterium]MBT5080123.1 thiamine-phosphate kinase [Rhodospirillaceae bacterium]MBT5526421.1 thiamine-phosphate kinase [Rhodospirillaceae bacterium]MBT5877969.1 thiamine-phosphate kinase [Rhodospirillaceae bacterium]